MKVGVIMEKESLSELEILELQNAVKYDKSVPANRGELEVFRLKIQGIMDRMAKEFVDPENKEKGLKGINGVQDDIKQINDLVLTIYSLIGRAPAQSRNLVRAVK